MSLECFSCTQSERWALSEHRVTHFMVYFRPVTQVSLDHKIAFHCSLVQFECFTADASRFKRFCSVMGGLLRATWREYFSFRRVNLLTFKFFELFLSPRHCRAAALSSKSPSRSQSWTLLMPLAAHSPLPPLLLLLSQPLYLAHLFDQAVAAAPLSQSAAFFQRPQYERSFRSVGRSSRTNQTVGIPGPYEERNPRVEFWVWGFGWHDFTVILTSVSFIYSRMVVQVASLNIVRFWSRKRSSKSFFILRVATFKLGEPWLSNIWSLAKQSSQWSLGITLIYVLCEWTDRPCCFIKWKEQTSVSLIHSKIVFQTASFEHCAVWNRKCSSKSSSY